MDLHMMLEGYLRAEESNTYIKPRLSESYRKWNEISEPRNFKEYFSENNLNKINILYALFLKDISELDLGKLYRTRQAKTYGSEFTLTDELFRANFQIKKRMDYYNSNLGIPVEESRHIKMKTSFTPIAKYYSGIWKLYLAQRKELDAEPCHSVESTPSLIDSKWLPVLMYDLLPIHTNNNRAIFKQVILPSCTKCNIILSKSGIWKVRLINTLGEITDLQYGCTVAQLEQLLEYCKQMRTKNEKLFDLQRERASWDFPATSSIRTIAFLRSVKW